MWGQGSLGTDIVSSPVIADVDGDFIPEVILSTETNIYLLNLDGTPKLNSPVSTIFYENYASSISIQDTDYDNDLEIILGSTQHGLFNIDLKSDGSSDGYWNMFRGNLYRNGVFETSHMVLSNDEIVPLPTEFSLNKIYPNPFNAVTKIDYSIPYLTKVKIEIIGLNGSIIQSIINDRQNKGNYSYRWNAENLSSGIYFIKFTTDKYSQMQKIMLIK